VINKLVFFFSDLQAILQLFRNILESVKKVEDLLYSQDGFSEKYFSFATHLPSLS